MDKIKTLANKLIKETEPNYPIGLNKIIAQLDNVIINYNVSNLDSLAHTTTKQCDSDKTLYIINVKGDGESERERFAIAKQLGHIFLGHFELEKTLHQFKIL